MYEFFILSISSLSTFTLWTKLSAVTEYNELRKIIMNDYLLQQLQHLN